MNKELRMLLELPSFTSLDSLQSTLEIRKIFAVLLIKDRTWTCNVYMQPFDGNILPFSWVCLWEPYRVSTERNKPLKTHFQLFLKNTTSSTEELKVLRVNRGKRVKHHFKMFHSTSFLSLYPDTILLLAYWIWTLPSYWHIIINNWIQAYGSL